MDHPSQPPPQIGGLGWMNAPFPRGAWITLYRATAAGKIGPCPDLAGSDGLAANERLLGDPGVIDEEFADGLHRRI